jgi:flagellar motor protein MotB
MAGVAAIFLLIAVVFILIAAKRHEDVESQMAEFQRLRRTILDRLDNLRLALESDGRLRDAISVDEAARGRDPFLFVIVFKKDRLAFEPARCELLPQQEVMIQTISPPVLSHVCRFVRTLEQDGAQSRASISMTLEGHTDRRPFKAVRIGCGIDQPALTAACAQEGHPECEAIGFANNVRLSGARAQNVFFSMRKAVANDENLSACLDRNFVVAGRGPVVPSVGWAWVYARTDGVD